MIITGRRADRLASLKAELGSNVETYQWDITDFITLGSRAKQILAEHPDINCVFLVAGVGSMLSFLEDDASESGGEEADGIIAMCNTNVTAQMLLARVLLPHLASVAAAGRPASLLLMGSGLGFVPVGLFPVYCATKAAVHALALGLRQQVSRAEDPKVREHLAIVEVVAPFVDTDFMKQYQMPPSPQPMPLAQYMDDTMAELAAVGAGGKPVKEAAVGTAKPRVELWRGSVGKYMNDVGLDC